MDWLADNWWIIVVAVAGAAVAGTTVYSFAKMPSSKQIEAVKEWLLYWVLQAEASLGGGTGKIKLSMVYDAFVQRFPWLAKMVSFETFSLMVDEVLEKMRSMLQSNPSLLETIKSGDTAINDTEKE